jgi:hypothetical protein
MQTSPEQLSTVKIHSREQVVSLINNCLPKPSRNIIEDQPQNDHQDFTQRQLIERIYRSLIQHVHQRQQQEEEGVLPRTTTTTTKQSLNKRITSQSTLYSDHDVMWISCNALYNYSRNRTISWSDCISNAIVSCSSGSNSTAANTNTP